MDAIKLATLTAEVIEEWRAGFIKRGAINPLKEKSARISANSFIGRARSLFGADVIARVKDIVELPNPIPFHGVKVERVRATRYRSTFDMAALLESARTELPKKLSSSKSFSSPQWQAYVATKSTSCPGARFAGTKAERRSSSVRSHTNRRATS